MRKRLTLAGLSLMMIVGCTSTQSRSQNRLKMYLKSHSYAEKDGVVTSISNQRVLFAETASGNAKATVEFTVEIAPREGIALSRTLHQYTLNELDGTWTVIEARTKMVSSQESKWLNNYNFHRQSDPVFSGLPWMIK